MSADLQRLHSYLYRLRRRAAALSSLEFLLLLSCLGSLLLLLAATLGRFGWVHAALPWIFLFVLCALPIAWSAWSLWPRVRQVRSVQGAARFVDQRIPELRNVTLSALELSGLERSSTRVPEGMSSELIQEVVADAARKVEALSADLLIPLRELKPWAISALLSLGSVVAIIVARPDALEEGLWAFLHPPRAMALRLPLPITSNPDGPALGDIAIELSFPAYLKRENEILENASGDITAPRGTVVTLSARGAFIPTSAQLLVKGLAPLQAELLPGGRFKASFVAQAEGTWRFLLTPSAGEPSTSRSYPIKIEEDLPPAAEILNLSPTQEISLNEATPIRYRVSDDHGLTRLELVVEGPGGQKRTLLREFGALTDRDEDTIQWFPAEVDLPEGSALELWIEVRDDDTVSGPKIGRSTRYKMTLASTEKKRQQNLEGKETLKESLIASLGESLIFHDEPSRSKTASSYYQELMVMTQAMQAVQKDFGRVRALMEEDKSEEVVVYRAVLALEKELSSAWNSLEEALKDRSGTGPEPRGRITPTELRSRRAAFIEPLESAILSMESFTNMQRMESILAKGTDLKQTGESLKEMLEEFKKSGKRPDAKAVMEKLRQMQQQLASMAQEMSQLDRTTSEWYQNPAGETREVKSSLNELQSLLEQGKFDEAMKMLEETLKNTDDLMNALDEMKNEEFNADRNAVSKDMDSVIQGLKGMEEQQRRLMNDTKATQEQLQRSAGMSPQQQQQFQHDALEKVASMKEASQKAEQNLRDQSGGQLSPELERSTRDLRDRLNTLESALKIQDVGRSLNSAFDTARSMKGLEQAVQRQERSGSQSLQEAKTQTQEGRKTAESLARDLQQLSERLNESRQAAAQQGQGLGSRQQSLREQGQGMGEKLKDYAKGSPVIPASWGERMQRAAQNMQGASGKLQAGELQGGVAEQQSALQELSELRKDMEQVQKEMQSQARVSGKGQGNPMPGTQPRSGSGADSSESWGRTGVRTGAVDISKDYKAPEDYRREILEGMKGDVPSRYKRLNREYYEKLVR